MYTYIYICAHTAVLGTLEVTSLMTKANDARTPALPWGCQGWIEASGFRLVLGTASVSNFIGCSYKWVVVKIMIPFGVPNIVRHLLFRVPKKGP